VKILSYTVFFFFAQESTHYSLQSRDDTCRNAYNCICSVEINLEISLKIQINLTKVSFALNSHSDPLFMLCNEIQDKWKKFTKNDKKFRQIIILQIVYGLKKSWN
jgi:hypothetical protein